MAGTPFDFRTPTAIGERIDADDEQLKLGGGYDHNFVLKDRPAGALVLGGAGDTTRSGRVLEVLDRPSRACSSTRATSWTARSTARAAGVYEHRSGFCLETQHFPDSPNHPDFPSTVLRPGETYTSRIVYRFSTTQ